MAMVLIRRWRLAVLRVRLDLSDREPAAVSELVDYPDGVEHCIWSQRNSLASFGIDDSSQPPHHLRLPDDLQHRLAVTLERTLQGRTALWLHLVPPYGYLGAVPWEDLSESISAPLLRVPDRLPRATDLGRRWTVAVAVSSPPSEKWGAQHVLNLHQALKWTLRGSDFDMDVFADVRTAQRLRAQLDLGDEQGLSVHDPERAGEAHRERRSLEWSRGIDRPNTPAQLWADWIADGLGGRAVRALHVVTHATFDGDQPLLQVASDPNIRSAKKYDLVRQEDLSRLADRVGAGVLSLGSPPGNISDLAARLIIDGIGQSRPGPTLYSDLARDRQAGALAHAHAFLADMDGVAVPCHSSLFAYLQPELVQEAIPDGMRLVNENYFPYETRVGLASARGSQTYPELYTSEPVAEMYRFADEVPSWIAASTRFLDTKAAELTIATSAPGEPVVSRMAYDQGTAIALNDIRRLIANLGDSS